METYKEIEQGHAIIRLFILTVIGASLNIIFMIFSFTEFFITHTPLWGIPQWVGIFLYFILTITYSLSTTLSFTPKRIVSPLYIQLLTVGILAIILTSLLVTNTSTVYANNIQNLVLLVVLLPVFFLLFGITGFVQTEILRRIVGLNGSEEDLERATYSIDAKFEYVSKYISENSFLNLAGFNLKTQDGMLVLKSRLNNFTERIILVLSSDPENKEKTILSTIVYEVHYTYISKSTDATERLDSILLKLDKSLGNVERIKITFDNEASRHARKMALKITEPRIIEIKYMPRYVLIAVIATGLLFSFMAYGRYYGHFVTSELFKSSLVLIALAVVFEFLPLIKDGLSKKSEKN